MKIKPEHVEYMKAEILAMLAKRKAIGAPSVSAYRESLKLDPRVKDLDKRLRWDLFWAAKLSQFASSTLYAQGCHDSHIDTALKAIMPFIPMD